MHAWTAVSSGAMWVIGKRPRALRVQPVLLHHFGNQPKQRILVNHLCKNPAIRNMVCVKDRSGLDCSTATPSSHWKVPMLPIHFRKEGAVSIEELECKFCKPRERR
jgi:hypothetical protein